MNFDEAVAAKRRISVYLVDAGGTPVPGLALSGSEVQVSLSGAAFVNGTGSVTEIGFGAYYYEAAQSETVTDSFIILKVVDAAAQPFVWLENIGDRIAVDEPDSASRRIPIYLVDTLGDPAVGVSLTGSDVQVSLGGAAFNTATGTVTEIGAGAYYYEATLADVADEGILVLRVSDAAVQTYVYTVDIVTAGDAFVGGTSGYFGYYFGTGGVETVTVTPVVAPTPVEADVTATQIVYTDHLLAAIGRLPQYAKSKVTDGDE